MNFIPVCEPALLGNEAKYVQECVETGWISSSGRFVNEFEAQFAKYCGAKYAVAVCNGTVALHLALVAAGIKEGDEVIIPNFTMIASAFAVCYIGAIPVFVDADAATWNIDCTKIEEKITDKTKAIMPVSIFGNPCDMDAIWEIARKYDLKVIEDAAESHGAVYKGRMTGTLGNITAFSFFANKNLTTGEGGMVVTDDEFLYNQARYYKNLCFPLNGPRNYTHEDIGFNYRISNIHAALGLAQVERADQYKLMRINNARLYAQYLTEIPGIILQEITAESTAVYWMNGILLNPQEYGKTKDELIAHLKQNGIDTRLFFVGMNKQPSLHKYGCNTGGDYSVTDNLTANGFYLPSGSNLTPQQIEYICTKIKEFHQ